MAFGPGEVLGGKYRLEAEVGRGGMGAIWRATHMELEVPVAVKIITAELSLSTVTLGRFKQEARAAAQLRSPHVVQVLDYGVEDGAPYMVMELLSGMDLGALIERSGRLRLPRVVEVATGVCKALRLAHEANIVHRDLKPENVFLATIGGEEIVKVLDFGIAKALTGDDSLVRTNSSTLVGSPLYMSPEQSRGEPVDARTDVWSLGVVLFEAITGTPPFDGRGLGDVFAKICASDTPLPSQHGILVPGLDEFFKKALAKDREERFPSAMALLEALVDCADAAPLSIMQDAKTLLANKARDLQPGAEPSRRERRLAGTQSAISSDLPKPDVGPRSRVRLLAVLGGAVALGGGAAAALLLGDGPGDHGPGIASDAETASASRDATEPRAHGTGPEIVATPAWSSSAAAVTASPSASTSSTTGAPTSAPAIAWTARPGVVRTSAPTIATPPPTQKPATDDLFGIPKK